MHQKRILSAALLGLSLFFLFSGCQNRTAVGEPPVPMHTVTEDCEYGYITCEFLLPEDWLTGSEGAYNVVACSKASEAMKFEDAEDRYPYMVGISNYYHQGYKEEPSEEEKKMYKELFAGKPGAYEKKINKMLSYTARVTPSESGGSIDFVSPTKEDGTLDEEALPVTDFQYQYYNGAHGKITEVRYSYSYNGKTYHTIHCFREDIPYEIIGGFDDSLEVPSGDIALWVANSLRVTEHSRVILAPPTTNAMPNGLLVP